MSNRDQFPNNDPLALLDQVFGYAEFRGAQRAIIDCVLEGGDALVLMPTGGGKSLCYQIPAIIRPGVGVVVSPLIALMQDQVDALRQLGVRAAYLNSSLMPAEAQAVEQAVLADELDLVYVAPERLLTERFLSILERSRVALFAIDEAHCVSQWGHDFRPEYIELSRLHERWPSIPRIALTATADAPTRSEIVTRLALADARQYVSSFDRPNIRYRVVEKRDPRRQLLDFINEGHSGSSGIVYCLSRKRVDETAQFLVDNGHRALAYHAGLAADMRRERQAKFLREEGVIMVATIAFGMGIDKPDVRFVAHLDLPKSLEAYYQETGRAGRDGLASEAWMAYGLSDMVMLRRFIDDSTAGEQIKRVEMAKLNAMLGYCETTECRRQVLLNYFGEQLPKPCGNCDTCLDPIETWDGTVAAQKAMSCIHRTGARFGVGYLVDVLRGSDNERIKRFRHDQVSTYGIGTELTANQWKSVYRQLVAAGLVQVDMEAHGALKLTEQARPVLRGERKLDLRRDPERKRGSGRRRGADVQAPSNPEEAALWKRLRELRRELAQRQDLAPYMIFGDVTLGEMVRYRPTDEDELTRISGVGQVKLQRYGAEFLAALAEHEAEHGRPMGLPPLPAATSAQATNAPRPSDGGITETQRETLALVRRGLSPEQVAAQRSLKLTTIYGHLAVCIEEGELDLEQVVQLPRREIEAIEIALAALPADAPFALKPVFESFDGRYSYGILRCVRAAFRQS